MPQSPSPDCLEDLIPVYNENGIVLHTEGGTREVMFMRVYGDIATFAARIEGNLLDSELDPAHKYWQKWV